MAYNVLDIAHKILSRVDVEHGDTISNLKLQKLLYFVQGFHLASFGEPLFDEDMIDRAKNLWNLHQASISLDGTEATFNRVKALKDNNIFFS